MTALAAPPDLTDAQTSWRLLAKIATIPAPAWEAIVPRGRVHPSTVERLADPVTPDCGSLPTHESVVGARLLQALVRPVARGHDGREAGRVLVAEVEDWCATGWPLRWRPPPPTTDYDASMVFAGGAVAAAHLAGQGRCPPALREYLGLASTVLAEAAVAG